MVINQVPNYYGHKNEKNDLFMKTIYLEIDKSYFIQILINKLIKSYLNTK